MLPAFDERALAVRLQPLPWFASLAFGVACAARLVPNYRRFFNETHWGNIAPIDRALDGLANAAITRILPTELECRKLAAECEAQAPHSEASNSLFRSCAQDAVFAVCSLLDYCAERNPDRLVLAARYPSDSVDLYVQETEHMSAQDPALEGKIVAHQLMQQELARQQRDLATLEIGAAAGVAEVLSRRMTEEAFV